MFYLLYAAAITFKLYPSKGQLKFANPSRQILSFNKYCSYEVYRQEISTCTVFFQHQNEIFKLCNDKDHVLSLPSASNTILNKKSEINTNWLKKVQCKIRNEIFSISYTLLHTIIYQRRKVCPQWQFKLLINIGRNILLRFKCQHQFLES